MKTAFVIRTAPEVLVDVLLAPFREAARDFDEGRARVDAIRRSSAPEAERKERVSAVVREMNGRAYVRALMSLGPTAISAPGSSAGTGWVLPEAGGGARIAGRWYTEHALERMAPRTPEVLVLLEARALARARAAGLKTGTPEFRAWWGKWGPDPRNVPPSVVEAEIANPGTTGVTVITSPSGDVVTVKPR